MTAADDYINRVLGHLPRGSMREQIAMELRGHIAGRLESGQAVEDVLRQLGDPTVLAESYLSAVPLVSASFWQRGAAKLIDVSVVVLTILLLVGVPTFWIAQRQEWPFLFGFGMLLMILAASFGFGLYTIVAEHWLGFTIGKRALGLRVVQESGAPIGLGQSIVRQLPMFLQIYWIDVLFALFTDKSQRAFELLSKTRVVGDTPAT
nr:hypothetical protein orf517 [uncultured bacterium]AGD93318.1 hypothetical protein orf517 [uncultured bacterium]